MSWQDGYYLDLVSPFGLRSVPVIFNSLADLFHWCLVNNWNVLDLLHYLNYYFTLGPPPPPANKSSCKLKDLQWLVGKLSHACTVVPQGRTFLRRVLDLLKGHSGKQSRFIRLNKECKLDIERWRSLLPNWDGVYFFDLRDWAPVPDLFLGTDASGSKGYGVFYSGEWFNGSWSDAQQSLSIAYKELFTMVIACHVWGSKWRDHRIQFCCDNQGVVAVISSGTFKDTRLMQLLRELFLCAARFNFMVTAKHVPGKENAIADFLSCFKVLINPKWVIGDSDRAKKVS